MKEYRIYVGLLDPVTRKQKFETDRYKSLLRNICRSYGTAFSVQVIEGGYFYEDGTYAEEQTLVITLIDVPEETVREIAKDVCAFFGQESVLVTGAEAQVFFVRERLQEEDSEET